MTHDFETLVRTGPASLYEALMPPAVRDSGNVSFYGAEMLYPAAGVIREAVARMAENGRFGFTMMDAAYRDAVVFWMREVRGFAADPEWIVPTLGVIHSLAVAIRLLTREGDAIIVTPPVYSRYEQAATRLRRKTVKCPLHMKDGRYELDFAAIDSAMAGGAKLFVLCNPHNPIGQIWGTEDLVNLAALARRHGATVFSDEIFAENSLGGRVTPSFLTIPLAEESCIVATSLGKAFGLTGFNHANMLIPGKSLREAFRDRRTREHYGSMDPVAYECLLAAYTPEGRDWLAAANRVIDGNIAMVKDFFARYLPDVNVYGGEGSFLLWMDWSGKFSIEDNLFGFLVEKARLHLGLGSDYGEALRTRMSLACPRHCVKKALDSLQLAIGLFSDA